jgi:exodeoxyribonuclease V beta subunit
LLAEPLTLNDLMITRAMTEIREAVAREKRAGVSWGLTIC